MTWATMDNAPEDRPVLGWNGKQISIIEWWKPGGQWVIAENVEDGEFLPIFWMDLPEPPAPVRPKLPGMFWEKR